MQNITSNFSIECGTYEQLGYWPNNFDDFAVSYNTSKNFTAVFLSSLPFKTTTPFIYIQLRIWITDVWLKISPFIYSLIT